MKNQPPPPGLDKWGWMSSSTRAWFYQFQYDDYLIGMNTTGKENYQASVYELDVPEKYRGQNALDLISGRTVELDRPVTVPPKSTVILHVGHEEVNN